MLLLRRVITIEIQILEIRFARDNKPLKAFADVKCGDWIVHDFRIVQQNGHRISVIPPQVSWKDPATGLIRFKGILTIPPEQKQRIDVAILHAYQEEMEKIKGETSL